MNKKLHGKRQIKFDSVNNLYITEHIN